MGRTARIFKNGRSQTVRLPAEFHFDADEGWETFFEMLRDVEVPDDFLSPEERDQGDHRPDPLLRQNASN
jgi:antitoxin VapB